jgi:hypothetical protein
VGESGERVEAPAGESFQLDLCHSPPVRYLLCPHSALAPIVHATPHVFLVGFHD